ncbi:endo-1,4-beta-xylanase [Neolewinella sp.]|uniref:endo-1,4-beta-xylanase n=1 Tax=Neolewinella sp. TaxID=2993543 RepID=UPI003B53001D
MNRYYVPLTLLALLLLLCTSAPAQSYKPAAEAAIRQHRMAPLNLEVVDANGNAVPEATVRVRMRESAFRWGSIVNINEVLKLERAGYPIGSNHPYWNHLRQFNSIGAGNGGKWKQWLNLPNRAKYLEVMDWLNENDIGNRLHAPIWPSIRRWNAVPDTVLNAQATATQTRAEVIRQIVRGHLESYMPIIQDKQAYEVDLVNELIHEADLTTDLMGLTDVDDRIDEHTQWYKWAQAAGPEVGLIVNEYDLYQSGNDFHTRFVDYVSKMIERGAPIDGVGMQGHFFGPIPAYEELKKRLAEVAVLDLPMAVTEFDMVNNTYEEMERVLYSLFSEPLVNNFTVWGAWDGNQWRNNAPIYNLDWSLKPSGRAYFDLVKDRWRTDTTLVAGQDGPISLEAFRGTYDVYVEYEGQVTQAQTEVAEDGSSLRIVLGNGYALPEGSLSLKGEPTVVYPDQPVTLTVTADADIEEVTFYDGVHIIGVDREAPFELTITRAGGNIQVQPTAEVTYTSGYRQRLTGPDFTTSSANQAPRIREVFPASGSTLLLRNDLSLTVEATDPNGDSLTALLLTESGDTLRATGTDDAFRFALADLSLGSNRFTLVVRDDKFGSDRQEIVLNIVSTDSEQVATSYPLVETDDTEEKDDGSIDVSGDLDLGEKVTAIRFEQAGIPAGATVDSAFVQFTSQKPDQTGPMDVILYAEKVVNPAPLSNRQGNLSARSLTETQVAWNAVPDWLVLEERGPAQRTPDLSPLLTELLQVDGWSATQPVHLLVGLDEQLDKRSAYSVDLSEAFRPELTVYYQAAVDTTSPLAPVSLSFETVGGAAGAVQWQDPNPAGSALGYNLELDGAPYPAVVRQRQFVFADLREGTYTLRVQVVGALGILSPFSAPLTFTIGDGEPVCDEDGTPDPIPDGLTIEDLGNTYQPDPDRVPAYLQYNVANRGGTTSVRRSDSTTLKWKDEGYYQRNRELGQVFNVPAGQELTLDAIVLRTGNSSSAILEGAPGAEVYMQFFEVTGTPVINDNGTPVGTESEHGFNNNHRTDDYLEGVTYTPIAIVRGGIFPDLPPTTQNGGEPGHLRYLRWNLEGDGELTLAGGKRYAFMVGFTSSGPRKGFSLGNDNGAADGAAPVLRSDPNGSSWWSIRREGDGTLPPTQIPGIDPPTDEDLRRQLIRESSYAENFECTLSPTTDGFPDVDTYRTLEFYVETVGATATRQLPYRGDLGVYPNPSDGQLTLSVDHGGSSPTAQLEVLTLAGRLVDRAFLPLRAGSNEYAYPGAVLLKPGLYLLRLRTDEAIYSAKITRY